MRFISLNVVLVEAAELLPLLALGDSTLAC